MSRIVDIIAPSGSFEPELLPKIKTYLLEQGLEARIPKTILGHDLISANNDATRFQLLKQALLSEDSNFIWCVRGGCGAARLLPLLQEMPKPTKSKVLMGFSDITALHLFLNQAWGWHTVHGAGARQIVEKDIVPAAEALTEEILDDKRPLLEYTLESLNQAAKELVSCEADLTGGNLKLVETSLGTFWQIESSHKIVLLEEVNEYAYRVDRSLVHLAQAGVFKNAKAAVFGEFSIADAKEAEKIAAVLQRFAHELKLPVFKAPFFGHGKHNSPWFYDKANIQNGKLIQ